MVVKVGLAVRRQPARRQFLQRRTPVPISIDKLTEPAVRATVAAVNAGDREAFAAGRVHPRRPTLAGGGEVW
jgi:hypothetical protein